MTSSTPNFTSRPDHRFAHRRPCSTTTTSTTGFASPFIVELSLIAVAALVAFVLEFVNPRPLVNFRLLGRRNLEFRC